ncbi:hypothetical protein HMPREF1581_01334 [Gardnerella vaginalis JCP8108]|uniref:Uncharacterized protein n=1 Tax=Gardnerella vaginalis JCP8108 TaxID=1261066 RepID=S4HYJ4_GARVA|nr:hypothetical protein HMPREF1581_01334 [Gardnerella vaginalis JCP8108]
MVNKSSNTCPRLFPFLVKWETKAVILARVCFLFWCFGKQTRENE